MTRKNKLMRITAIAAVLAMLTACRGGMDEYDGDDRYIQAETNAYKGDMAAPAEEACEEEGYYAADEAPFNSAEQTKTESFFFGNEEMTEVNTEEYNYIEENGYTAVSSAPLSTFSSDVDTASYTNVRRMIYDGVDVPADAVRIEEMINYFDYGYSDPENGEPFAVHTELSDCPWNKAFDGWYQHKKHRKYA